MVDKTKIRSGETTRLDATAWTQAALEKLAKDGIDGVRVELLAKELGVTKGSFYWHFKDRAALHDSMLVDWRRRATLALIERLDKGETSPEQRLRRLLQLPLSGQRATRAADVELAIRLWSRREERARHALEEVDQLRISYISGLLRQCGVDPEETEARAVLAYSYMRVAATLIPVEKRPLMTMCEDLLLKTHFPAAPG